jgi:hypothetical protein
MKSVVCFYIEKLKDGIKRCTIVSIFKPEIVFVKGINVFNIIGVF